MIDRRLNDAGWIIQDMNKINLSAALGVAIREFPTSTGPVNYALFVAGKPVGVVEAKKNTEGQNITVVEANPLDMPTVCSNILMKGMSFAYEESSVRKPGRKRIRTEGGESSVLMRSGSGIRRVWISFG